MRHPVAVLFALATFSACSAPTAPAPSPEPVTETREADCSHPCADALACALWADDLGDVGTPERDAWTALVRCSQGPCSASCGPDASAGLGWVDDGLTQWCDADLTAGTGIPRACEACLSTTCGAEWTTCVACP